ncbi:ATP-binding protein [Kitasatospora sp. NPDC058170]|uniref:ATP-binding protein n=1 Tax=Kitasatospora sp. NPDC058170 TaxID=3346364 RepID=UPI0036DCE5A9
MPRILTPPRTCADRSGTPPHPSPRHHQCDLAADELAPSRLRAWIGALLADWQLPQLVDDLALIATELATNAVRHGGTPARATLAMSAPDAGPRVVRLEIQDSGPGFDPRTCAPTAESSATAESCSGRGLLLVAALSSAWGALHTGAGQLVWAELTAR